MNNHRLFAAGRRAKRGLIGAGKLTSSLAASKISHRPFYISHLVTTRCNCSCPMCIWRDNRAREEMSAAEIGRFYKQASQNGFKAVGIWGGEPLLRKDLAEVLSLAKKEGLITTLLTNGFYLQERIHELHPNIDSLIVSLDYPDEKHDQVRGCEGLFERVTGALEETRKRYPGLKVMVNCLLHSGNEDRLQEIADLCRGLDVSFYVCPVKVELSPETEQSVKGWEAGLDRENEAGQKLLELKRKRYPLNNSYTYLERFMKNREPFRCHLPKIALIVYPNGEAAYCAEPSTPLGNVNAQSFAEIMTSPRLEQLKKEALSCNRCNNPNIVESSYMWELKLEPIWNAIKVLAKN